MSDTEKAKQIAHLFFITNKSMKAGNLRDFHDQHMRKRDVWMLGTLSGYIKDNQVEMIKMSEISTYFHITPAAVSQMIKEYERKGWVERTVLSQDRRSVYLKVTDEGLKMLKQNEEEAMKDLIDFLAFIGEEDSDALIRILEKAASFHWKKREERSLDQ